MDLQCGALRELRRHANRRNHVSSTTVMKAAPRPFLAVILSIALGAVYWMVPQVRAATVNAIQDFVQIATPANPAAGLSRLYFDSTLHQLACLNSDGSSCAPSSGGTLTWTAFSYNNSWADFGSGFQVGQWAKDSQGTVHWRGLLACGTTTIGTTILTLPAAARPTNGTTPLLGAVWN